MAGWFELKKANNGQFYFSLKAGNGETILTSEMYVAKSSATSGIASVQKNSGDGARYKTATSSNGKFYFTLRAGNNQVIGNSQMYSTEAACNGGIESSKQNGATQDIRDNS
ncbi:YegP family protein [Bordetella tumulicola]|uniref:YegP family protein n=1 Tax=Bordetella tumulicola TaxID=1649133 RepID=UPI0039EECCD6